MRDGQNERELRMKNDDIMTAEEFFGEVGKDTAPVRTGKALDRKVVVMRGRDILGM